MPKKKINHPTEDPITVFNGAVYSSRFINYDDSGKILSISLEKEGPKFLEIENDLIPNFISSTKDYNNYNIQYFLKIKQGLITDEDEADAIVKFEHIFYSVKSSLDIYEIQISHDRKNRKWYVNFSDLVGDEMRPDFTFYVVRKDNKNMLLSSYNLKDVSKSNFEFNFKTELEESFEDVEVLVYKKLKYYSLKELA